MEEHQHQLAHQCSPNIIGMWKWGICSLMVGHLSPNGLDIYDLMEGHLYHLMCGAFMT